MPRNSGPWTTGSNQPPSEAFHVEHVIDPFTLKKAIGMVRHAGHPFVIANEAPDLVVTEDKAWDLGTQYLIALAAALHQEPGDPAWIDKDVWERLRKPRQPNELRFGWLRITWGDLTQGDQGGDGAGTLGSFWVDRFDKKAAPLGPRLLVLVAGTVVEQYRLQLGSDLGLRIVMQVYKDEVRIHGVTMCGLSHRRALDAVPILQKQVNDNIFGLVGDVNQEVGRALKAEGQVWVSNLETSRTPGARAGLLSATGFALRWRQDGQSADLVASLKKGPTGDSKAKSKSGRSAYSGPNRARAYDFRVDVQVDPNSGNVQIIQVHRHAYIGSGARAAPPTVVRGFVQDAASKGPASHLRARRPTRDEEVLDQFCDDIELDLASGTALAFGNAKTPLFETRGASRTTDASLGGRTVERTDRGVVAINLLAGVRAAGPRKPILRSDEHASIETHVRAAELFERMQGYGINPLAYFRFARLPLVQRARPAMRWAPDGELPNAEVRPFMGDEDADKDRVGPKASDRLQLLVRYGSADPMQRHKLPLVGSANRRRKAQYLSVACDPRWAWHEFGHVLNFASTGELEFPFAHSAGDALAAIAADPLSELATAEEPNAPMRHVTFPWIEVPGRSHGREAVRGYGWCGCRNKVRLDFKYTLERYHHSYFGEQLLSSSLFRLYRSLGGDTRGNKKTQIEDEATRLSASDYCIYLIMRGISLLGPDTLAPARTPDQLVSALIEADLGTSDWQVQAVWPFNRDQRDICRRGGRVHKVIRWAFEQQGLFATEDPIANVEDVGLPPSVDVYIKDRGRPGGGYEPIPLRDVGEQDWHAHSDWMRRDDKKLKVQIANRGLKQARDVSLRVWWGKSPDGSVIRWQDDPIQAGPSDIDARQVVPFELTLPGNVGKGRLWFLASADSPADPSNLAEGLPRPPEKLEDLMELVAHDNNLGLCRL